MNTTIPSEFQVIGYWSQVDQIPGFVIPVFDYNGAPSVQSIDENGATFTTFLQDRPRGLTLFPRDHTFQRFNQKTPIFGFIFSDRDIEIAAYDQLSEILRARLNEVKNHRYIHNSIVEFLKFDEGRNPPALRRWISEVRSANIHELIEQQLDEDTKVFVRLRTFNPSIGKRSKPAKLLRSIGVQTVSPNQKSRLIPVTASNLPTIQRLNRISAIVEVRTQVSNIDVNVDLHGRIPTRAIVSGRIEADQFTNVNRAYHCRMIDAQVTHHEAAMDERIIRI